MDGGSVSVRIVDNRGGELPVSFKNDWMHDRDPHGGQFHVSGSKCDGRYVARDGADADSLLLLLRIACMKSFASVDPEMLAPRTQGPKNFSRMAMASLFRQIDRRPLIKPRASPPKQTKAPCCLARASGKNAPCRSCHPSIRKTTWKRA
jgi:hypothetical protein